MSMYLRKLSNALGAISLLGIFPGISWATTLRDSSSEHRVGKLDLSGVNSIDKNTIQNDHDRVVALVKRAGAFQNVKIEIKEFEKSNAGTQW
jgi:hypothetical protein